MMRGKSGYAICLLRKNGRSSLKWFPYVALSKRRPFWGKPFLRGVVALFESMAIGVRALMYSASEQEIEPDDKKGLAEQEKIKAKAEKLELSPFATGLLVAVSFIFGLGLFVALPNILIELFGINEVEEPLLFNLISGVVRILIFVLYVFAISLMKDIRRVFEFHGAEHKAVNCFEADKPVTLANTSKFTTLHPRCGTGFMFFVLLVAILLFAFVPLAIKAIWPEFTNIVENTTLNIVIQKSIIIPLNILLLPLVSGIAYEVIRFSWRYRDSLFCRMLMVPGFLLQRITTRSPDQAQIRVAVLALNEVLKRQDEAPSEESSAGKEGSARSASKSGKTRSILCGEKSADQEGDTGQEAGNSKKGRFRKESPGKKSIPKNGQKNDIKCGSNGTLQECLTIWFKLTFLER
jgi:uncharacterized protein YqhQ